MSLPFSAEAFLEVFGEYNRSVWPAVVVGWLLAAVATLATMFWLPSRRTDVAVTTVLAALWAWSGGVYHAWLFTTINPPAGLFAALFLVEAAVLFRAGAVRQVLSFGSAAAPWRVAGIAVALYGLAYPGLALLAHPYPNTPTFGVPCPTTILTVGLLLTSGSLPAHVVLIPLAWSLIGGSAAFSLGVPADLGLLACAPLLCTRLLLGDRAAILPGASRPHAAHRRLT
jgi:hypothetical protein